MSRLDGVVRGVDWERGGNLAWRSKQVPQIHKELRCWLDRIQCGKATAFVAS